MKKQAIIKLYNIYNIFFIFPVSVYVYARVYAHIGTSACKGQKRISGHVELELQLVVSLLTWVLSTKLQSPERAASALPYRAISPASLLCLYREKFGQRSVHLWFQSCGLAFVVSKLTLISIMKDQFIYFSWS